MSNPKNPVWNSIPVLIVAVIAVLAFVRGKLEIPLLTAIFILWAVWFTWKVLVPRWRERKLERDNALLADWTPADTPQSAVTNRELENLILLHVNYRISGCLTSFHPNARWEWAVDNPAHLAVTGGIGRIRVYGIPDYDYADIELDKKAHIKCSLIQVSPLAETQAQPSGSQPLNPQIWFETQGRETLERLVNELNSRGHNTLYLKEDGSICTQQTEGGNEAVQGSFPSFPEKVYWSGLADVLRQNGLAAKVLDHFIQIAW